MSLYVPSLRFTQYGSSCSSVLECLLCNSQIALTYICHIAVSNMTLTSRFRIVFSVRQSLNVIYITVVLWIPPLTQFCRKVYKVKLNLCTVKKKA
jgi:hypothetical protein